MTRNRIPPSLPILAEAVSKLFHPFVEVVVHDLNKNRIAHLSGQLSPRKAGDPSYLSKADRSLPPGVYGPYSKLSSDGKAMKSVSMVLPAENQDRFMVCINFNISEFQNIQSVMSSLVSLAGVQALEEIFDENWQDKIHKFINETLKEKHLTLSQLSRDEKKELVFELRKKGAFKGKNAAAYIAQVLDISRASVYGYLKENE